MKIGKHWREGREGRDRRKRSKCEFQYYACVPFRLWRVCVFRVLLGKVVYKAHEELLEIKYAVTSLYLSESTHR